MSRQSKPTMARSLQRPTGEVPMERKLLWDARPDSHEGARIGPPSFLLHLREPSPEGVRSRPARFRPRWSRETC
jgi:hypothetical protein